MLVFLIWSAISCMMAASMYAAVTSPVGDEEQCDYDEESVDKGGDADEKER